MTTLCTICARGGSRGIKNKNIRKILNVPLIVYTIDTAIKSKLFDKIVLSTDSNEIINICKNYKIDIFFKRPNILSEDITFSKPPNPMPNNDKTHN